MDNHNLVVMPIKWFLYSSKYDENAISNFLYKKSNMKFQNLAICMKKNILFLDFFFFKI